MIKAITSAQALPQRYIGKSNEEGRWHWRTDFIGQVKYGEIRPEPQAFLVDMRPSDTIPPHFHAVDQFQVFVAGSGSLARNSDVALPVTVHYVDHHTGYGPVDSGPQGFSYFGLRAKTDSGPVFLHQPGYREKLIPSKKRHFTARVTLSIDPVLLSRDTAALEPVIEGLDVADGLGALVLRMGPAMKMAGPDPRRTGGQYYLVMNGSLERSGESYPAWSVIFQDPAESALEVIAGSAGLEALILQFPRDGS